MVGIELDPSCSQGGLTAGLTDTEGLATHTIIVARDSENSLRTRGAKPGPIEPVLDAFWFSRLSVNLPVASAALRQLHRHNATTWKGAHRCNDSQYER